MNDILNTIFDATLQGVFGLLKVGIALAVYQLGRIAPEHFKPKLGCYATMLGVAAFLGFMAAGILGSHVEDADQMFGGGELVHDYEPTEVQRLESGVKIFIMAGTLLVLGAAHGFGRKKRDD